MALQSMSSVVLGGMGLKACAFKAGLLCQASTRTFSSVLDGYKYAKSHEWAKEASGGVVTVGISDHAQAELGDVVYVELPEVGKTVTKGEPFGVVESVKAASDVYSPVSGEVTEVNSTLVDKPATVNSSPFEEGWLMKVKLSDKADLDSLLDAAAYKKEIGN